MSQRGGLGRGLGALIPGGEPSASVERSSRRVVDVSDGGPAPTELPSMGVRFAEIPLESIRPNARQPREVFDEEAMAELVYSIREIGLLQPVVVRPLGADQYELVAGERRLRATKLAGHHDIAAIVRETADDEMLRDALLENLHRAALNPLEEAAAYSQMLEDFGCTQEELAGRLGRSRPQVTNTLRLLKLPPSVGRRVAAGVISAGHARALLTLTDSESMERLAGRIVAEGLSVRTVEEIAALGLPEEADEQAPRRSPNTPSVPDAAADLATRIAEVLETRVKVSMGRNKGKLTIEFASVEDLSRIASVIDGS